MLNKTGKIGLSCLVPALREKAFHFSLPRYIFLTNIPAVVMIKINMTFIFEEYKKFRHILSEVKITAKFYCFWSYLIQIEKMRQRLLFTYAEKS